MNRPIALVCYICGREFGTKSLGIHLKTCEKKWHIEESFKPPKQRRPCPRPPPGLEELLAKPNITRKDVEAFNSGSFNTFKEEALVECEYCQRKFNPKSLIPHQKACKTNPMLRKPLKLPSNISNQQNGDQIYGQKSEVIDKKTSQHFNKRETVNEEEEESPVHVPSKGYNVPTNSDYEGENVDLVPCSKCSRKFASDRVDKHEKVCKGPQPQKVSKPVPAKQTQAPKNSNAVPKWKAQSSDLQNAMKEMRKLKAYQEKGGNLADLPPPPKSNYDHYTQCPHCGRKYAPEVAERHIPKCANIVNKPGGIKPSKIQEKYISGTGAGRMRETILSPKSPNLMGTISSMNNGFPKNSVASRSSIGGINAISGTSSMNKSMSKGKGFGLQNQSSYGGFKSFGNGVQGSPSSTGSKLVKSPLAYRKFR